jgi:hypothetical protein
MAIASQYRSGTASILRAGRALESAFEIGEEVEIQQAVAELRRAAEARELGGGAVAGFASAAVPTEPPEEEADETLAQVLAELNVGETLLAAGSVAGERDAQRSPALLSDALGSLQEATSRMEPAAEAAIAGFGPRRSRPPGPALDVFRDFLPQTVDTIVRRTAGLGSDVVTGLVAIPASALQPVVAGAVAATTTLPDAGPLVAAGLRAVQRTLQALQRLIPGEFVGALRDWAKQWWDQHADPVVDRVVRGLLGAEGVKTAARDALARPGLSDDRLRSGYDRLVEVDERHERTIETVRKIVRILTRLVGPLAALFAAVAAWLYGIGAVGYLLALGAGVWVGRDYLDTGGLAAAIPGVRAILAEVAG